jgi:hydroxymethylpyrimidine pyrophosphatase-like HAD family hydrolase
VSPAEASAHLPDQAPRPAHSPAAVGLFALDIDGTVATFGQPISRRVRGAVRELDAAGVHVVLATGRSVTGMLAAARELEFGQGWAVCSNGSVIARLDPAADGGFEVTDTVTFDPGPALAAVRRALPKAMIAVEDVGRGFAVTGGFPQGELHGELRVAAFEEIAGRPATRVIVRTVDLSRDELAAVMAATDLPSVTYDIGWSAWMDLTPPGVTKASALETLRVRLGVPPSGTVAVGDGTNDIPMLRWASRGIAMGGALPEVVQAASEQCLPIEDDPVASVIEGILGSLRAGR